MVGRAGLKGFDAHARRCGGKRRADASNDLFALRAPLGSARLAWRFRFAVKHSSLIQSDSWHSAWRASPLRPASRRWGLGAL